MGEHHALGLAGGAGGVDDGGEVIRADGLGARVHLRIAPIRGRGRAPRAGIRHHHAVHGDAFGDPHVVHHHDFFQRGLRLDGQHLLQVLDGGDEDHARARIFQQRGRLLFRQRGINRDVDCSQEHGGEIGHLPFGAVLAEDGHPVAFGDAPLSQRARRSDHVAVKLARGDGNPLDGLFVEHHLVEVALDDREEDVVDGPVHSLLSCAAPVHDGRSS